MSGGLCSTTGARASAWSVVLVHSKVIVLDISIQQGGFMSSTEQQGPAVIGNASSQRLGRPVLTTLDAIAQSLAIGPIFSSAFVAFLIAGVAASAAPLPTLIGAIGVLALGWVVSLY